ncbi:BRCA1-associated RING domain protein 1-like [Uloborus diversus]|uniref:BRCA1-associated RING domain protein 1-like n=1 Tax=Uloborus diversus TaxID=327109 RepID=UPI002409F738|nr:BRCA1-associated RING domain protein 1-like [Uloborus diversus]
MSVQDILNDVENLEATLKCHVCNNIFNDPLLIAKCGHTTCKQCFVGHFELKCPVCSTAVNTKDYVEDKQMKDLIAHLGKLKSVLENLENPNENIAETSNNTGSDKGAAEHVTNEEKETSPVSEPASVGRKRKLSLKNTPNPSVSSEDNIIQDTPNLTSSKKVGFGNATKVSTSEKKRLSSNFNSPNASGRSTSNLDKKNHKGETLLHCAVIKGDIGKVKELLAEGASVNTQDNSGWTPLHEASNRGFVEIAKMLLDAGALVNVPSSEENITPLHDALYNNQIPVAILLASRGADMHAKTSTGKTALDLCRSDEDRNILIESCSPFISANVPLSNISSKHDGKMVFLSTNLSEDQKAHLQKGAQLLNADIVSDFSSDVTHVITSCDKMGNCTRTLKILLGILSGKWIMNFHWIEVCLDYKQKVDEEVFEVQGTKAQPNTQGPKRGRENMEQKFPPLFDGFYFYLHGSFTKPTPEREDLCLLIQAGGGKILSREPRVETVVSEHNNIPFHAPHTPLEDVNHVILYQDKPPRGIHFHHSHICTTQVIWLIECISEFKILEAKAFQKTK